jgi:hypothetical protein
MYDKNYWQSIIPKSEGEFDILICQARRIATNLKDDDLWHFCQQMILLASCNNQYKTRQHKSDILYILADLGEKVIDPILDVLTLYPNAEQFDTTRGFISALITASNKKVMA